MHRERLGKTAPCDHFRSICERGVYIGGVKSFQKKLNPDPEKTGEGGSGELVGGEGGGGFRLSCLHEQPTSSL